MADLGTMLTIITKGQFHSQSWMFCNTEAQKTKMTYVYQALKALNHYLFSSCLLVPDVNSENLIFCFCYIQKNKNKVKSINYTPRNNFKIYYLHAL